VACLYFYPSLHTCCTPNSHFAAAQTSAAKHPAAQPFLCRLAARRRLFISLSYSSKYLLALSIEDKAAFKPAFNLAISSFDCVNSPKAACNSILSAANSFSCPPKRFKAESNAASCRVKFSSNRVSSVSVIWYVRSDGQGWPSAEPAREGGNSAAAQPVAEKESKHKKSGKDKHSFLVNRHLPP
jgi:hypothetical protein